MTSEEKANRLVETLRAEAGEVKECFTKFSFQTLAISTVVLSLVAKFQNEFTILSLASILVFVLCLTVVKFWGHNT